MKANLDFILAAVFFAVAGVALYLARGTQGYISFGVAMLFAIRRLVSGIAARRAAKLEELSKLTSPK